MEIEHKGVKIEYTIEYRKRKSVELTIDAAGVVRVKAPKGSEESAVQAIVFKKRDWIIEKLELMFSRGKRIETKTYEDGETFLFLGKKLKLVIYYRDVQSANIALIENELIISCPENYDAKALSELIEKHYRKELKKVIENRVKFFQSNFKVKPKKVLIKEQKTRWGSCSSERNINFNWKLIMAPIEIIDYLVVHEMCHLVHMNHSKSFWTLVGKILPDYKIRQNWLNKNGFLLELGFKIVDNQDES